VAVLFCRLGSVVSLRDIANGLPASAANCGIWACPRSPSVLRCRMPTHTAPASFLSVSSIGYWRSPAVRPRCRAFFGRARRPPEHYWTLSLHMKADHL
jgi:hypothetical protein